MKLLIVEDDFRLLMSLARAFREDGYAVDSAGNGEEGLFRALNEDYDAVILDVRLPLLNGWEVLERLRVRKRTPVLMLTALGSGYDKIRGFDSGADDYVVKPFDLPELRARVRALIRRSNGQPNPLIVLDGAVMDTRTRSITKDGQPVPLTPREFSILHYVALQNRRIVSRSELFAHIFSDGEEWNSNLLDVHISAIRKKLSPDVIKTRRGEGYFCDPTEVSPESSSAGLVGVNDVAEIAGDHVGVVG